MKTKKTTIKTKLSKSSPWSSFLTTVFSCTISVVDGGWFLGLLLARGLGDEPEDPDPDVDVDFRRFDTDLFMTLLACQ